MLKNGIFLFIVLRGGNKIVRTVNKIMVIKITKSSNLE